MLVKNQLKTEETERTSRVNVFVKACSCTHLKRKSWLFIVNSDKNLPNNQLFAVITEHKLCAKAFIIFSLLRDHNEDASFELSRHIFAIVSLLILKPSIHIQAFSRQTFRSALIYAPF